MARTSTKVSESTRRRGRVRDDRPPAGQPARPPMLIGTSGTLDGELADDAEVRVPWSVRERRPRVLHRPRRPRAHPGAAARPQPTARASSSFFHVLHRAVADSPAGDDRARSKGIARGGGSELALSLDLRFGAIGRRGARPARGRARHHPRRERHAAARPRFMGGEPCARGRARVRRLRRRARRARTAGSTARSPRRDRAVRRSAGGGASRRYPREAVRLAKEAVDAAGGSLEDGLLEEASCFNLTLDDPELDARMEGALAAGARTASR